MPKKRSTHNLLITGVIIMALVLRFDNLGVKGLWETKFGLQIGLNQGSCML